MVYVKSLLAGVAALLVATVLYLYIYYAVFIRPTLPKVPPGTAVGIDVRIFFGRPYFWLIAFLAFAIGCYWEFRRATR
jgi:hypothetical protein